MFIRKLVSFFVAFGTFFSLVFNGDGDVYFKNYVKINMVYGAEERQVLDLYLPRKAEGDIGLILFLHGGAWIGGDKESYRDELKYWTQQGYAAAAMNYRYVSDTSDLNDIMDDITAGLEKIKAFGEKKNVNIDKMLLTGSSAGGHLSLLYAYSRVNEAPIKPAAVVSYCGPVDLTNPELMYGKNNKGSDLGTPETIAWLLSMCCGKTFAHNEIDSVKDLLLDVSPVKYINKNCVPTVICHGAVDTVVPYSDAVTLDRELTKCGVKHDFITYPNSNHGLDMDPVENAQARQLFIEYAEAYVK